MKSLNVFGAKKIRFMFWLKIFCISNVKSCQSAFKSAFKPEMYKLELVHFYNNKFLKNNIYILFFLKAHLIFLNRNFLNVWDESIFNINKTCFTVFFFFLFKYFFLNLYFIAVLESTLALWCLLCSINRVELDLIGLINKNLVTAGFLGH